MTTDALLHGRELTKAYGPTHALAGVDITISPGESVAIMGPSGSGKTTLLHVLAGIITPTSGDVRWKQRMMSSLRDRERTMLRRDDFGFVFQAGHLLPELPVSENVALPLLLAGVSRADAGARAQALLVQLGLQGMEGRRPGELSGGQAQRVAIARALVAEPAVVFADEPTGALDQGTSADVMRTLVSATSQRGASLVVVTHDVNVARWCSRTITMRDGRIEAEFVAAQGQVAS